MRPSMGSTGDARDNALAERFFASRPRTKRKPLHMRNVVLDHDRINRRTRRQAQKATPGGFQRRDQLREERGKA